MEKITLEIIELLKTKTNHLAIIIKVIIKSYQKCDILSRNQDTFSIKSLTFGLET